MNIRGATIEGMHLRKNSYFDSESLCGGVWEPKSITSHTKTKDMYSKMILIQRQEV